MKRAFSFKNPSQKRKAALIPVLAIGLLWTLCQGEEDPNLRQPPMLNKPAEMGTETPATALRTKTWTDLPVEEIAAFNPFPLPPKTVPARDEKTEKAGSAEAAHEQNRATSDAERRRYWETQSVSIIYQGPKGPVAVIGSKTIGVGDMLDENLLVVDIRPDGIWVSQISEDSASGPARPANSTLSPYSFQSLWCQLKILGKKFGF